MAASNIKTPALFLRRDPAGYLRMILAAVVVGVLGAMGNLGLGALIRLSSWLFRNLEWRLLGIDRGGLHLALIPLILLSGGALILLLSFFFPGDVLGYGFPAFLEQVNLGNAQIKRRWIFVKAVGTALSLGSGASVGREGPIAQIGGAIGSAIAQLRGLGTERAKVLVAAGAGAGIATTFNAPIGGLMFAQEIVLLGHTELANLSLLIVATTSAVVTSRAIQGDATVFNAPRFVLQSYWEILTYILMGVLLGLLGASFVRFFHETHAVFRRMKVPDWAKLGIGLSTVGIVAIWLPQNLSDGYPVINQALAGQFGFTMLATLALAKFFTSSVSLGSGAPGGSFGPIFFIGTMAGGAFHRVSSMVIPELTGPRGSYALVGLGAFLTATTHAPLTALFLLFEMTGGYQIVVPAMIATVTALVVARAIEEESIDTYKLAREGKTLQIGQDRLALTQIPVSAVMTKDIEMVHANAGLMDVLRAAGQTGQSTLPVVGSEGELDGLIVTRELLALVASEKELGPLINAYDLARLDCPEIRPTQNLDEALQTMEAEALDEIPVVEHQRGGRFLGLVTRQHVAQALNRVSVSLTAITSGREEVYWATGYRIVMLEVTSAAQGTTVRTYDPRARFGVNLLALRSGVDADGGFVPLTPDRSFKTGDKLIVAGRPADIRRFERELLRGGGADESTESQPQEEPSRGKM